MQIQIQNVILDTNSNLKDTGNLWKGVPVDFCSKNQMAHFCDNILRGYLYVVTTALSHQDGIHGLNSQTGFQRSFARAEISLLFLRLCSLLY
jgi:hypothetical protein